jgi:hypothetical protein
MPIRRTKPRNGSKPMIYFKGTQKEANEVNSRRLAIRLQRNGLNEEDAKRIIREVQEAQRGLEGEKNIKVSTSRGGIIVSVKKLPNGRIFISQKPITRATTSPNSYQGLIDILQGRFKGRFTPNAIFGEGRVRITSWAEANKESGIIHGDKYAVETNSTFKEEAFRADQEKQVFVEKINPSEIVSVNIKLNRSITTEERKAKMDYYKKQIQERFGIPVKFVR